MFQVWKPPVSPWDYWRIAGAPRTIPLISYCFLKMCRKLKFRPFVFLELSPELRRTIYGKLLIGSYVDEDRAEGREVFRRIIGGPKFEICFEMHSCPPISSLSAVKSARRRNTSSQPRTISRHPSMVECSEWFPSGNSHTRSTTAI